MSPSFRRFASALLAALTGCAYPRLERRYAESFQMEGVAVAVDVTIGADVWGLKDLIDVAYNRTLLDAAVDETEAVLAEKGYRARQGAGSVGARLPEDASFPVLKTEEGPSEPDFPPFWVDPAGPGLKVLAPLHRTFAVRSRAAALPPGARDFAGPGGLLVLQVEGRVLSLGKKVLKGTLLTLGSALGGGGGGHVAGDRVVARAWLVDAPSGRILWKGLFRKNVSPTPEAVRSTVRWALKRLPDPAGPA